MITKTYKLLYGQTFLSLMAFMGDRTFTVEFTGGKQTPFRPGRFTTNRPRLQKFIETHVWFGKKFVLDNTVTNEEPETDRRVVQGTTPTTTNLLGMALGGPKVPAGNELLEGEEGPDGKDVIPPTVGDQTIEDIVSGRTAKEWLLANVEGITSGELTNNEKIRSIAAKHKVTFPNWK